MQRSLRNTQMQRSSKGNNQVLFIDASNHVLRLEVEAVDAALEHGKHRWGKSCCHLDHALDVVGQQAQDRHDVLILATEGGGKHAPPILRLEIELARHRPRVLNRHEGVPLAKGGASASESASESESEGESASASESEIESDSDSASASASESESDSDSDSDSASASASASDSDSDSASASASDSDSDSDSASASASESDSDSDSASASVSDTDSARSKSESESHLHDVEGVQRGSKGGPEGV
eukprot:910543-Prorocentrum_minimum.AAC.2